MLLHFTSQHHATLKSLYFHKQQDMDENNKISIKENTYDKTDNKQNNQKNNFFLHLSKLSKKKLLIIIVALIVLIPISNGWHEQVLGYFLNADIASNSVLKYRELDNNSVEITNHALDWESENFTIPSKVIIGRKCYTVTSIGKFAFYNCEKLKHIKIPSTVTNIGEGAFLNCTQLTTIDMSENIKSIGSHAFKLCEELTSIKIPEGVTIIRQKTFEYCHKLKVAELPESLTIIEKEAFVGTDLAKIEIPSKVDSIGSYAFGGCENLK